MALFSPCYQLSEKVIHMVLIYLIPGYPMGGKNPKLRTNNADKFLLKIILPFKMKTSGHFW